MSGRVAGGVQGPAAGGWDEPVMAGADHHTQAHLLDAALHDTCNYATQLASVAQ